MGDRARGGNTLPWQGIAQCVAGLVPYECSSDSQFRGTLPAGPGVG